MVESYSVSCDACGTSSTTLHSLEAAVNKIEGHHAKYGCTYPDEQSIEVEGSL